MSFIELARRQQLIEATIAAVAEEGYAGASLAKVASRAKISKSVVVYYFGTKDVLVETTVREIYQDIWKFLQPRFEAESTARGQLRTYIEAEFAYLEQNRARLLTISYLLMNHRNRRGALYLREEAEKINLQVLGGMLENGQKRGEFRAFAVKPMAATLMHAINGALEQWVVDPRLSLAEYAQELVTIFDLATRKQPEAGARGR
jgi:AcrR family transcriptional regulator